MQRQNEANCAEQRDPLDKYSKGIIKPIHNTYPGSVYACIKEDVIEEWRMMEGETLLAIPFGSRDAAVRLSPVRG